MLNEFMHAEYGIFVYTIWPLFGASCTPAPTRRRPARRRHARVHVLTTVYRRGRLQSEVQAAVGVGRTESGT
jgi:hypothetical protein